MPSDADDNFMSPFYHSLLSMIIAKALRIERTTKTSD